MEHTKYTNIVAVIAISKQFPEEFVHNLNPFEFLTALFRSCEYLLHLILVLQLTGSTLHL